PEITSTFLQTLPASRKAGITCAFVGSGRRQFPGLNKMMKLFRVNSQAANVWSAHIFLKDLSGDLQDVYWKHLFRNGKWDADWCKNRALQFNETHGQSTGFR
ncbi:hypothetical protein, partial [Endozoicomonas sp. ONNA2]|uniref:hypothetical protein n=1 Tax=Endozoicomonas sp. ONNA2 TaxID=2828741 RepID=UPI002148CB55